MRRALSTICIAASAALASPAHAGTVTEIGPFSGAISESWQGFENYMFNPDFYEQSPATIFGGQATITSPLMIVYEPGFADFGLGSSGIEAQVADGTKAMGLNDADQTATIDFVTPVTEFGAWWAATTGGMFPDPNTISVTFFDAGGELIETVIVQYSHSVRFDGELDWHGWSSTMPIGSIVYRGDYVAIDAMQANEVLCESDLDGDGSVGVVDLLDLLAAWGPNPGHPADLDGDGAVGVTDLLQLLAEWRVLDPHKKRLTRVTCSQHVTPFLRAEVESLGLEVQEEDHVGVHVGATLAECMRLNLRLRTALAVLWLLKRFRCPSSKALYTHAASFPWEELIPNDSYFCVTSNVDHPSITNSMYPNLVLKDAIVDRITKRTGARPDSGPDRSRIVIQLYWKSDRAWIYLNTSGRRLADRGYRKMPHAAPMQETLAAAVLLAAGYDGTAPLVNPMCGSGTLAIEAALIATGRAPGLLRAGFGFMHTRLHDEETWQMERRTARKAGRSEPPPPILASDSDPAAIAAARQNARTAGVEQLIRFETCDFAETPLPDGPGIVIMNPEYGERLGEMTALEPVYARIGDFLKQRCAGWTGCVFTGNRDLSKRIGLRTARRVPFMNARIECRLLAFDLYEGSRTGPSADR